MISHAKQNKIALIVHSNVAALFAMMLNDTYRGPSFEWNHFPHLCGNNALDWAAINLGNPTKEEKDLFVAIAESLAAKLLVTSGLLEAKTEQYESVGYAYIAKGSGALYLSHSEANPRRFEIFRKLS